MREIKFRGKWMTNGEWVTGDLMQLNDPMASICTADSYYFIDRDTIGQYTGLKDSQGNEIYEGDIVKFLYKPTYPFGDSEFDEVVICKVSVCVTGKFILEKNQSDEFEESLYNAVNYDDGLTVVGNIHDNPELIKEDCNERY